MSDLAPIDRALLQMSILSAMTKRIKIADINARAQAAELMRKGDTLAVRSPLDDTKIARVSMSDPAVRATFTDRQAADRWVVAKYPERLVERTEISGPMAEVIATLRTHAPHLLTDTKLVPDWAANELLTLSERAKEPAGYSGELGEHAPPGIRVHVPDGVLTVTLDKVTAASAIEALWDAHMVGMDGALKEIEGAP